jgi:hypothetical protein
MSMAPRDDHPPFYETYVKLVPEVDLTLAMDGSLAALRADLERIDPSKADYAYAPGKWTVKGVLRHAIDTERIFAYRALCIARGETKPLPGFDEQQYAAMADLSGVTLRSLKEEMLAVRISTGMLFGSFSDTERKRTGTANEDRISVEALGYILIGHWRHHMHILSDRYGI